MLIVVPVSFRKGASGELLFEAQACNGLECWANSFEKVVVAAPLLPEAIALQQKNITWRDTATLFKPERFELVPLPWACSPRLFATHYFSVRQQLAALIDRCQYLQFPLGGLFGDWGALAAQVAYQKGRPYAIHTDLVEEQKVLQVSQDQNWFNRLKAVARSVLSKSYYHRVIRRSTLALLHGSDCYTAYHSLCQNSFLVHDIHTKPQDVIPQTMLQEKLKAVAGDRTLRICYTGRMVDMKAPLQWVRAIGEARRLGVELQATWVGDGELRQEMQQLIEELGLKDCIELTGYESDRQKVLQQLRDAHILLFTHITPESPRCLIEAFISGTAIVGYSSHYAEDLTRQGGGAFVPTHCWNQLGQLLQELWQDRCRLTQLIQQAADQGHHFNDEAVFLERSQLIKQYLT
ncbi:MAG: glycosyltransferase [Oculatellaceae cyanobacterium Prado106]|nr:glycosyltransferase [Oculatellaceae cyanobacterium Prado106]